MPLDVEKIITKIVNHKTMVLKSPEIFKNVEFDGIKNIKKIRIHVSYDVCRGHRRTYSLHFVYNSNTRCEAYYTRSELRQILTECVSNGWNGYTTDKEARMLKKENAKLKQKIQLLTDSMSELV